MQKEVKVVDYLREVAMTLSEIYKDNPIPTKELEVNARIFFNTFGIQTVKTLIAAYDEKTEGSEEVYKCLLILFRKMKREDAEYFITTLKQGLEDMQEKEKSAWDE